MSNLEQIKGLWERAKSANHNTESLTTLLADYTRVLSVVTDSDEAYKTSLRRLREEIPDLQRLVTKKHDPILKGRLQDAINALRRKVEEVEAPPAEVAPVASQDNTDAATGVVAPPEDGHRVRNMPNLGMD